MTCSPSTPRRAASHAAAFNFRRTGLAVASLAAFVAGCGEQTRLPQAADVGPRPTLTQPNKTLLPTVNIAPAVGWPRTRPAVRTSSELSSAFKTTIILLH